MDSRWHCGCKSFGLRCLGKATGNLGEKEIKENEFDEVDERVGTEATVWFRKDKLD